MKKWNNKFRYQVASCWLFLLIHTTMHGSMNVKLHFNPLNAELSPICHLLTLLGAHYIFHVSGLKVKGRKKLRQNKKSMSITGTVWTAEFSDGKLRVSPYSKNNDSSLADQEQKIPFTTSHKQ